MIKCWNICNNLYYNSIYFFKSWKLKYELVKKQIISLESEKLKLSSYLSKSNKPPGSKGQRCSIIAKIIP